MKVTRRGQVSETGTKDRERESFLTLLNLFPFMADDLF
jgi:hypothetical protein